MIKRKLVILLLIICFVLSLQAAFASNDLNNTDASAYSSIDSNDNLKIDNADSFSQLQDKVNDGGVINLNRNYSFNVVTDSGLENGITISKNVDLNGNGNVIIDAQKKARIFNIADGVTVTLRGITFINANVNGDGGAIHTLGTLNMNNCKFINNTATNGGAVYLAATVGSLTNLDFINNHANEDGGAIYFHHNAVTSEGSGANGINFINNTAGRDGGALFLHGVYGRIYNSNFINNVAYRMVVLL